MSEHKIKNLIKSNGFKYIKQKWVKEDSIQVTSREFIQGEQEEDVDMTVLEEQQEDLVHVGSHVMNSQDFTQDEKDSPGFTLDEMNSLRRIINEWDQVKQPATEHNLINRIEAMPKDEKVRKTIVISKVVGEQLDEFCKINRVQKSTVLELAIKNLLDEY